MGKLGELGLRRQPRLGDRFDALDQQRLTDIFREHGDAQVLWLRVGCCWRFMSFFGGLAMTYLALLSVHTTIGTQHILLTIAPGILPNVLFCSSYALLLMRTHPVACLS